MFKTHLINSNFCPVYDLLMSHILVQGKQGKQQNLFLIKNFAKWLCHLVLQLGKQMHCHLTENYWNVKMQKVGFQQKKDHWVVMHFSALFAVQRWYFKLCLVQDGFRRGVKFAEQSIKRRRKSKERKSKCKQMMIKQRYGNKCKTLWGVTTSLLYALQMRECSM